MRLSKGDKEARARALRIKSDATTKAAHTAGRVSADDLQTAISWLECNEGEGDEGEACKRVAAYLMAELKRRDNAMVKRLAKRHGCTIEQVREAMTVRPTGEA